VDDLAAIPDDLLAGLRAAVASARYDDLVALVDRIGATWPHLATGLRGLGSDFDYDSLRSLLDDVEGERRAN